MRKKLVYAVTIAIAFIIITFILTGNVYAGTQKLNNLSYDVILNADGSANVTEIWDIRVSETNTLFKTFELNSSKYGEITDVRVSEISSTGSKTPFNDTGKYAYHVAKGGYYALETKKGSEFEIAWGVSIDDTETRTYQIEYKIKDAIKNYTDCSEFYWQFIGDTNGIPAKNVVGKIKLPREVSNKDSLKVWAHGPLNGNIEIVDNGTVSFEVQNLSTETMVEVRIVTTEDIFYLNANKVSRNKLDNILSEEQRWADQANRERKTFLFIILAIAVVALVVITIFLVVIIRYIKILVNIKKAKPEMKLDYFRDFPDEKATPAEAAYLYYFDKESAFSSNVSKIVSATILNLALKNVISFEQGEKKDVYICLNTNSNLEGLSEDERKIYDLLVYVNEYAKKKNKEDMENKISTKDIEKYAKTHDTKFLGDIESLNGIAKSVHEEKGNYNKEQDEVAKKWKTKQTIYIFCAVFSFWLAFTIILFPLVGIPCIICAIICGKIAKKYRMLTQKGANEQEEWKALKKYMEDFSLLNEREVPELVLWEKYLVYATAFGIADKVLKQLKVRYPELNDETYLVSHGYTYMYMANRISIDSMISSGIQKAYNAGMSARAARNYSSRRWTAVEASQVEVGGRWRRTAGMGGR